MKLYLVRHGETIENSKGIIQGHLPGKLSEKGIKQAQRIGNRLKDVKFDAVFSSDLFRARETTGYIVEFHPYTDVVFTEQLREVDMGANQGKTKNELKWKEDFREKYIPPAGGESTEELYRRAKDFLKNVLINYSGKNVLAVSHGGTIKAFVSILTGIPKEKVFSVEHQNNTGLTIFSIKDDLTNDIILLNDVEHLDDELLD